MQPHPPPILIAKTLVKVYNFNIMLDHATIFRCPPCRKLHMHSCYSNILNKNAKTKHQSTLYVEHACINTYQCTFIVDGPHTWFQLPCKQFQQTRILFEVNYSSLLHSAPKQPHIKTQERLSQPSWKVF